MKSMQGLLHETTLQTAQGKQQAGLSSAAPSSASAGQKRSWSSGDGGNSHYLNAGNPPKQGGPAVQFQRAPSFIPGRPKRLNPSRIINCDSGDGDGEGGGISEYSQRQAISATPTSTIDPELSLSHPTYDLPTQLVENFASRGIKQIYPWQKNCLKGPGLLDGKRNLVYCAPTGGGKSLIADCKSHGTVGPARYRN